MRTNKVRYPFRPTIISLLLSAFVLSVSTTYGQSKNIFTMTPKERAAYFAKINAENGKMWERMVKLLHIELPKNLPPPANDPNRPKGTFQKKGATNWTDKAGDFYVRSPWGTWNNYDEARANPYPLPNPLLMNEGKRVSTAAMWWQERRPQIVAGFNEDVFGKVPKDVPPVHWVDLKKTDTTMYGYPVVRKRLVGRVDNSRDPKIKVDIQLSLTTPANAKHPVPVIMEFSFNLPPGFHFPGMKKYNLPPWHKQVLERGWGYAEYIPTSVQPDNAAGLTKGIIGLTNRGKPRQPDQWGALRAWGWGASQALDYFETDPAVNAKKVGLEGLSRFGKAVLVTMAYDQRFAIVLVGSSGKGGAVPYRRDYGESMGVICSPSEYHWFAGNLLKYVLDPNKLPVDSNELIAMCAPRPVFISEGSPLVEGRWLDDKGQFMSEVSAGAVYRLLGKKGLSRGTMPPTGTPLLGGTLAFRQHHGPHTVVPNWPYFLKFAARYLGS